MEFKDEMQVKIDELISQKDLLNTELENAKAEQEKIRQENELEIERIKKELEELNGEQAQEERAKAQEEQERLIKEVTEKKAQIDELKRKIDQQKDEYLKKLEQLNKKLDEENKMHTNVEEELKNKLRLLQVKIDTEVSAKNDIQSSLDIANNEIERLNKSLRKLQEDTDFEISEYRKNMEKQKEDFLKQMEEFRKIREALEDENRTLNRNLLNVSSHDEMLLGKSKTLEDKIKAIQQRYEDRLKVNEEEITKLRKESTTFRHDNELLKSENYDYEFRVNRAEYNEQILQERLSKTNEDYATLLTKVDQYDTKIKDLREEIRVLTIEKNDAEDLVTKKRTKLKFTENRIQELEEELKDKDVECKNRIKAYERMK